MTELHALLIGIDRYRPGRLGGASIPDLQACVNDVERMEAFLLAEPVALSPERIRKLISPLSISGRPRPAAEDLPTYGNVVRELEGLCDRAEAGDQVLVHYSGHGARVATAVPAKKTAAGKDEGLVPCDAGGPGGELLRDVELHALLLRLAKKGVHTTLILDCCHSGGITRALPHGQVRGLGEVKGVVPGESLLGSWDELAALLQEPEAEAGGGLPAGAERAGERKTGEGGEAASGAGRVTFRNLIAEPGWFPQPEGCVLVAACRPTELAREFPFEDGRWSGALTHFLLQSVGDLGSRPTYRWLHHRLLGRIRGLFETQTPLLEGEGDRLFLGRESWPAAKGFAILGVDEGEGPGRSVQLAAGRAQGLGRKARLRVAPRAGEGEAGAELEVTELGASTSKARIFTNGASGSPVAPGDTAIVVDPGLGAHRYPVRVEEGDGDDAGHREALDRLRQVLESGASPLLLPATGNGAEPEYLVAISPKGALEIRDPSGEAIPHQGQAIPATDPDAPERLAERLTHLASYKERERLENPDHSSPLAGRLKVELFALECMDDWLDPEARTRIPAGAAVPESTLLCLLVRNQTGRELNFAVLDFQPDWGITQVHPARHQGAYTTLEPGQEHPVFLKAGLPRWMSEGRDRLKVIATTGPLDATTLELPALGESTGYRSFGTNEPEDVRKQLFKPGRAGGGFRHTESLTPVSHEWAVETVEVRVVKGSFQPS